MSFSVGDRVWWSSQSQGYAKRKEGFVVQVLSAGQRPDHALFYQLYKGAGIGLPRKHESYVVKVGSRPYWPLASKLKAVEQKTSTCVATDCHLNDGKSVCHAGLAPLTCGSRKAYLALRSYDRHFGDNKMCMCGHSYYRHFDTYEDMRPVGCKYCGCETFQEGDVCRHPNITRLSDTVNVSTMDRITVYTCDRCMAEIQAHFRSDSIPPEHFSLEKLMELKKECTKKFGENSHQTCIYVRGRPETGD